MPPGPRIYIHGTSSGFVSPNIMCSAYAASIADADVERAIAEKVQGEALAEGIYVAKWVTERGVFITYVFKVVVETHTTHHVEVV